MSKPYREWYGCAIMRSDKDHSAAIFAFLLLALMLFVAFIIIREAFIGG